MKVHYGGWQTCEILVQYRFILISFVDCTLMICFKLLIGIVFSSHFGCSFLRFNKTAKQYLTNSSGTGVSMAEWVVSLGKNKVQASTK